MFATSIALLRLTNIKGLLASQLLQLLKVLVLVTTGIPG